MDQQLQLETPGDPEPVPIIRNDKFIPQHFVDAVLKFKFVFLQCIQVDVFAHRFLEIENESGRTQSRLLPNQCASAGVLQKFWQKFQNIFFAANECRWHENVVISV